MAVGQEKGGTKVPSTPVEETEFTAQDALNMRVSAWRYLSWTHKHDDGDIWAMEILQNPNPNEDLYGREGLFIAFDRANKWRDYRYIHGRTD
jgi:hypothetical protein